MKLKEKINTWIFDLDNTLYSADSGIFQQVHKLMGEFISKFLNMDLVEAKKLQSQYYKQHGTTLRGMMDNHGVDPDHFLEEVHRLDYSIVGPNEKLNNELKSLKGRKIIYTNEERFAFLISNSFQLQMNFFNFKFTDVYNYYFHIYI